MIEPKLLDDKRLAILLDKYGNLLHTIANKISGDPSRDHDDYYQELVMEFIPAIQGFETKVRNGLVRGYESNVQANFEEYVTWKPFDQYVKTVLWYYKNRIGVRITEKFLSNPNGLVISEPTYSLSHYEDFPSKKKSRLKTNKINFNRFNSYNVDVNSDGETVIYPVEDKTSTIDLSHYFNEIKYTFTSKEKELLNALLNSPGETMFSNGNINVTGVSKLLKLTHYEAKELILSFSSKINLEIL